MIGYELHLRVPTRVRMTGPTDETWELPAPVGKVRIRTTSKDHEDLGLATEILIRGEGFNSMEDAKAAGEVLRDWLRQISAQFFRGYLVGGDRTLSGLTPMGKELLAAQFGVEPLNVIADVEGLQVFDTPGEPMRIASRAEGTVTYQSSHVRDQLVVAAGEDLIWTDPLRLGADLVSSIEHESTNAAKFLTACYALDVLCPDRPKSPEMVAWIEELLANPPDVWLTMDESEVNSVRGGLAALKQESGRRALARWTALVRGDESEVRALCKKIKDTRDDLVHKGQTTEDLAQLAVDARALAVEILFYRIHNPEV
jgi:hypothetical protein